MTLPAIGPQIALVDVILLVAGVTVGRCILEDQIGMAGIASYTGMLAGQFEARHVVFISGWFPSVCRVAASAVRPQLASMWIILSMAGVAIGRRLFKVCNATRPAVTLGTGS